MRSALVAWTLIALGSHTTIAQTVSESSGKWPNWRGPYCNGFTPDATPPIEWSETSGIAWKRKIPGRGSGSPIVWGDRVFVTTAVPTSKVATPVSDEQSQATQRPRFGRRRREPPTNLYQFQVLCLSLNSGEAIWSQTAIEAVPHEAGHSTNTHASASPVTDGTHVFASFGSQGIFCFTIDGDRVWQRDLGEMQTRNAFGEGASPALYGDTLVVNWDHEGQSFITALDAASGEPRWQRDRDERTTWATPTVVEAAGKTQVIVNASNRTRSYDLMSGDVIWQCGGQVGNPIPTPVVYEDTVICMSGYRGAAIYAVPLDATGDITDSDLIRWHVDVGSPYVPSPLLYGWRLYFTKSNHGILSMVDARSGEFVIDQKRLTDIRSIYASPVGADGRVYISGRDGTTTVLRNGDDFDVLAVNHLDEGIDASPALVGKRLLLRGTQHLYCISQ